MQRSDSVWMKYHTGGWPEYPECSMTAFLRETAEKYPDNTALEFYGKKTTFRQLMRQIDLCAAGLRAAGIRAGDYVSIVMPNTPQAVISVYAVNRIGAVANVLHPLLSKEELYSAVRNVHSRALITLDAIYPKFRALEWAPGEDALILLASVAEALPAFKRPVYRMKNRIHPDIAPGHRVHSWHSLLEGGAPDAEPDTGRAADTAVILYSGGTTGSPKGVMLTNGNFNCLAVQSHDVYERDDIAGTHSLALMPVFHGFGLGVCIHGMLCNALHVFLVPVYDMVACTKLIFKRKISFLFGVPALYEVLSRAAELETKDCSFLKFLVTAGDRMQPALMERLNRKLAEAGSEARVREAYGLTECTSGCCINPFFALKPGSLGLPYTDMRMQIVRPGTEEALPDGETGEICISGPTVMKGYLNAEAETAAALRRHADGLVWLHTGDLGWRDAEGYYFFAQREARMIITAGYNVYPTEIEAAILASGIVKECCVIGKPDRALGQRVCAFAVLKDPTADRTAARETVLEACRTRVAAYALPSEWNFPDELPLSSLGKVDFRKLEQTETNIGG